MKKKVLTGASVLLLTSLVVKILSAIYRIPLQNMMGNEGFYSYQQVYPIYGLGMSLALTGVPLYVSQRIAEEKATERTIRQLYTITSVVSGLLFICLLCFAKPIALLMGNGQLTSVIQAVSFVFLLTPFLGMMRGIYQGHHDLYATAYSQLGEQLTRVIIILMIAFVGTKLHFNCYKISTGAFFATFIAAFVALVILLVYRKKELLFHHHYFSYSKVSFKELWRFMNECSLLSLSVSFMLVMQLLDSFFLPVTLMKIGISAQESFVLKGIFDRGQPLIQVGLVLTTVIVSDFSPLLIKKGKDKVAYQIIKRTFIHLGLFIGVGAGFGLSFLLPLINQALFENNEGSTALSLLMLSVVLMSGILLLQTLAQSQKNLALLWQSLLLATLIKGITAPFLIAAYQLVGAALSTVIALIAANCLYLYKEREKLSADQLFYCKLIKVTLVYITTLFLYRLFATSMQLNRIEALLLAILGVVINGVIYLHLCRHYQLLTIEEWKKLPLGEWLMKVGRIHAH